MYILLCGQPPFYGDSEEEIFEKIKECEYDFKHPAFKKVSKNCKDLIRKLLEPKKQYRIKAIDALKHPFFTENFDPNSAMTENTNLTMLKQFIHPIKYTSKFHEAIIAYLSVNFITVDEENELRRLFRYMDKEGKNAITKEEMKKCLEEINLSISDQELQKVFESVDDNGSGYIEYQEFIRNACNIKNLLSESNLKNVFQAICGDKEQMSGLDIKNFIFHDSIVYEHTLQEYFEQIGMRYQESITFEQFYLMIKKNKKLGQIKKRDKSKRESKYTFDGPIIDEADDEEDLDEENEDEKENKVNKENKDNEDNKDEKNKKNEEENKETENKENDNEIEKKNNDNNNQ
jgi:calcium-dependent protein kinase